VAVAHLDYPETFAKLSSFDEWSYQSIIQLIEVSS
jgi:hypothetical protein